MVYPWVFQVHDHAKGQERMGKNVSGWLHVCTAGTALSPTVYTNESGGATLTKINTVAVVSITNGRAQFWLDSSITSIDVSFLLSTGECGMARGIARDTQHMLVVNSQATDEMTLWIPFSFIASSAVVDTTLDLPADLLITDAGIYVSVLEASDTIDFGFINAVESGDEDGLLDGMLTTNAGDISANGTITGGTNIDYVAFTNGKYGALLADVVVGSDAVATVGGITRKNYRTDGTIKSLCYTPSSSSLVKGFLWLKYMKMLG